MDEVAWNHAVFSKNRERLLNEEIAEAFFQRVLERARGYISDEHFTVEGGADRGLGGPVEFSAQRRGGKAAGSGKRGRLSRGKAREPDP
jgi:hypothetical protein